MRHDFIEFCHFLVSARARSRSSGQKPNRCSGSGTHDVKKAFGGIVINQSGQVLLREPTDHYKGHIWTFAKGKAQHQESPDQTALREVLEETGVRAEIVMQIPGSFDGSTTSNEYFLMKPIEDTGHFDSETQAIRWVTQDQARELISLTLKPRRRRRDLRVLKLAFALFLRLNHHDPPPA